MFIIAQIGRALQFQDPKIAEQLCSTLLNSRNLDSFRASWSKIMRGIYAVRSRPDFETIFPALDAMLDRLPGTTPHLLIPEANLLHFLRAIRFVRTETRGSFVRRTFDGSSSSTVKRACIDCWRYWRDRPSFNRLRNQWGNLKPTEQRMAWLAAAAFTDEGVKARDQLRASLAQSWNLGFETENSLSFAACYESWAKNAA
jgi:hypothetical protein